MGDSSDIIIPHAKQIVLVSSVRSTLLQSSLATLKVHGHFERYLQLIDPSYRDIILDAIAPSWLPIEAGIAHYHACDELRLDPEQLIVIGESVGERMQGPFMDAL